MIKVNLVAEESAMAVKVLLEWPVRRGREREVLAYLRQLRASCLDQPGYISGETLRENSNPSLLLVNSTWYGLSDRRQWEAQEQGRTTVEEMCADLSAKPRVRIFLEVLSASVSGT